MQYKQYNHLFEKINKNSNCGSCKIASTYYWLQTGHKTSEGGQTFPCKMSHNDQTLTNSKLRLWMGYHNTRFDKK